MAFSFPTPPISSLVAHALSAAMTIGYVGSLYIASFAVPASKPLSRNDPRVIKLRLCAASMSTVGSCAAVLWLVWTLVPEGHASFSIVTQWTATRLGLYPPSTFFNWQALRSYLITPILFLGPIYAHYLSEELPLQKNWSYKIDVVDLFLSWQGLRNYIMGPITEEVVYRACVLSVLHLAGCSKSAMITLAPCWFGLAHVHHAYEVYKQLGRTKAALERAVMSCVFQFAYTTVFGWYCSYLFLRTGSVIVPTSAHIFCNIMGLPQISWELHQHPTRKRSIIVAYITGIILFCFTLVSWTRAEGNLYWDRDTGRY